jgi:hypothetical protein
MRRDAEKKAVVCGGVSQVPKPPSASMTVSRMAVCQRAVCFDHESQRPL